MRRKCEYGFFQITNAKKSCQITSLRLVIWQVFGMSDVEKPILTFPISQYSHCRKLQIRIYEEKTCQIATKWRYFSCSHFLKDEYNSCSHFKKMSKTHVHTLRRFEKKNIWKIRQILLKCEHKFYSSFFHSFATITFFYNAPFLKNKMIWPSLMKDFLKT